jgi:hypothetical protein
MYFLIIIIIPCRIPWCSLLRYYYNCVYVTLKQGCRTRGLRRVINWAHSERRPLLAYCTSPGWLWGWRRFCGMKIGRGNRNTRRKRATAPLCPPKIPLDQNRARTRATAVRSRPLEEYLSIPQNSFLPFIERWRNLLNKVWNYCDLMIVCSIDTCNKPLVADF